MFTSYFKNRALTLQNQFLAEALEKSQAETERMTAAYKTALSANQNTARHSEMAVDYEKMNAFSIERVFSNGEAKTVIGYMHGSQIREWNLFCDDDMHQELVDQFKQYITDRKKIPSLTVTDGSTTISPSIFASGGSANS